MAQRNRLSAIQLAKPKCLVCKMQYFTPSCGVYGSGGSKTCSPWCENVYRRFFFSR